MSFLFGVLVSLLLLSSCSAQCTSSVYTPDSAAPPHYPQITYAQSGNDSFLWLMPIVLTQPALVTGISIYPWNSSLPLSAPLQGRLNITGALYSNLSLISQSSVVTVTDFSSFTSSNPAVPLSLAFQQAATVAAGNYSAIWWYSWAAAARSTPFLQYGSTTLPTLWQIDPQQLNLTSFATAAGRLPAQLPAYSPSLTVWPGILVSLQYQSACYSSSSTGNGAAQGAAGLTALPLAIVALAAVLSLFS